MEKYMGKSVYKGTAIGPVNVLKKRDSVIRRVHVEDTEGELRRLDEAKEQALLQLSRLYDKALQEVGEVNAAIFEVHQMMLEDDDYQDSIRSMIRNEQVNAEYAVAVTGDNFAKMFSDMDDEYMQARSADVKDISERLVRNLGKEEQTDWDNMEPSIIVADDLTPSETVQMDKNKILAFVTVHGSTNSHTAILARMMNIPALIGVPLNLEKLHNGTCAVVDGKEAAFYLEPDDERIRLAKEAQQKEQEQRSLLDRYKGRESVTKSGRKIHLYANIGSVSDVAYVLENDAEGIGLFRSEFLYLGRTELPDETEQFNAYRQVLQMMAGKKVVIRTLDIGADKNVDYLGLGKEDNPAMGYRAIRICLEQPDIFKTQLRALLRAAKYGELAIMYPMIISVEEVRSIKEIVAEVARELEAENIPYAVPEQGIMIETPAAVMMSSELAELVDFFSIGTNDLTQYTLAIDRQNSRLDRFYNPHHEAVLRMIQMTVDGAHKHGKWVGICGELGADTTLTERFVRMGIDELSVSPSMVLGVRSKICEME
ncbi:MAG: phosphoenolpyruvate--protein phosphotransferase [Lachnospiraceae bacterium]|nr:phosphoenolpyruvate--protein phosphotransferase [Lachnospiraceae bacterium]